MDLSDLADQKFGPSQLFVTPDGVADFVDATGDDPERWIKAAPPGFMAVALFVVAPELLAMLYEHSVIHGEQSFTWNRSIEIGTELAVTGVVTRSRERAGVYFITFEMQASDSHGVFATGSALFLAAGESAPTAVSEERAEPEATDRGDPSDGQLSASRSDLIKYSAATRDWNPLHWDHASAVAAGLPGVVCHGLLQASWAIRTAAADTSTDHPIANCRIRFRNPLMPANPVDITSTRENSTVNLVVADDDTEYITARIEMSGE